MARSTPGVIARRARTAAGLPGRVVEVENRSDALERGVAEQLAGMREELAELRRMLGALAGAQGDLAALCGRLLEQGEERLVALEQRGTADRPES